MSFFICIHSCNYHLDQDTGHCQRSTGLPPAPSQALPLTLTPLLHCGEPLFLISVIVGCLLACLSPFSRVWLCGNLWAAARQVPLSMGFFRQGYWSGLPRPPPGDLPNLGIEPASHESPALPVDSLLLSHCGKFHHRLGRRILKICIKSYNMCSLVSRFFPLWKASCKSQMKQSISKWLGWYMASCEKWKWRLLRCVQLFVT